MAARTEQAAFARPPDVNPEQRVIGEGNASLLVTVIDDVAYPPLATRTHLAKLRGMEIRDNDIWIISYPKGGTHWTWEIIYMLRNQSHLICKDVGSQVLLEVPQPPNILEVIDKLPSPRMIISHLPPHDMPEQMWSSKAKIFYPFRNPKDALVSQFYHFSAIEEGGKRFFSGTLDDWLRLHFQFPDKALYGGLVNHVHGWIKREKTMPNRFLAVEYEAMKKNPSQGVQRIAEFLGVPLSPELKAGIVEQTDIQKLKSVKLSSEVTGGFLAQVQHWFYRKGEVGGWKSQLTVAQNEAMDALLNSNLLYKDLSFTYTL